MEAAEELWGVRDESSKRLQYNEHGCKHWSSLGKGVGHGKYTHANDIVDAETANAGDTSHRYIRHAATLQRTARVQCEIAKTEGST